MSDDGSADEGEIPVDLLHPFYLDTDMSMAFAAALAGGVALEWEDVEREQHESEAAQAQQRTRTADPFLTMQVQPESAQIPTAATPATAP